MWVQFESRLSSRPWLMSSWLISPKIFHNINQWMKKLSRDSCLATTVLAMMLSLLSQRVQSTDKGGSDRSKSSIAVKQSSFATPEKWLAKSHWTLFLVAARLIGMYVIHQSWLAGRAALRQTLPHCHHHLQYSVLVGKFKPFLNYPAPNIYTQVLT